MTRKNGSYKNIVGEKYGKWTVLSFSHSLQMEGKQSVPYWNCVSDEGESAIKSGKALRCARSYKPHPRTKKDHYIKYVSELTEEELEERREYYRRYRETHREQLRKAYKKHYEKSLTLEQKLKRWLRM